jgi:hypothetical protein
MPFDYSIKHEDSLIRVTVTGLPDYLSLDQLWRDIVAACKEHECLMVLGESKTEGWHDEDAYDHAAIFQAAGLTEQYCVAWVEEHAEAREKIKLAEAVVLNRGIVTGRVFNSVAEAKRWLAEKSGQH